jgi:hypothetical protein
MQEFDETEPIRKKFETFKAQAPEFDSLFEGEVLGDAPLRQIYQSKLSDYKTKSPTFDQMFAGKTLINTTFKKRMIPLWIAVSAAAACFALLLLIPKKTQVEQQNFSRTEPVKVQKAHIKTPKIQVKDSLTNVLLTEILESPKTIQTLAIDQNIQPALESLSSYEEADTSKRNMTKIEPAQKANLAVTYERSIEEAYAAAKIKKAKRKHEKMILGTNINSTNRLLSLVNSKSTNDYPLQGISSNYSTGYSTLAGSSSSLVNSDNSSSNAWTTPTNLSTSILDDYKAVYSLPLSVGLSVSLPVFKFLEVMTGLNYTYLSGTISGQEANYFFKLKQELHYLGIPLKLSVNFLKLGHFGAYVAVGGTIEKGLAGVQHSQVYNTDGTSSNWKHSQKIYGFQTSLTGQLGATYELNKTFNLYFEPGCSYYRPNNQPISSRTEEPCNFNLGLGLRYRME